MLYRSPQTSPCGVYFSRPAPSPRLTKRYQLDAAKASPSGQMISSPSGFTGLVYPPSSLIKEGSCLLYPLPASVSSSATFSLKMDHLER